MTIVHGASEATISHSTVLSRDAIGELGEAVINVLRGVEKATCAWAEEPGEYRWVLERHGEEVRITILWFRDSFSRQEDEKGRVEFATISGLRRFALQVKNVVQAELEEVQGENYAEYLSSTYTRLDALLSNKGSRP